MRDTIPCLHHYVKLFTGHNTSHDYPWLNSYLVVARLGSKLKGEPPSNLLLHLDELLERVSRSAKPAILLLDEVQELARSRTNAALVASLRTGLDKRRDGVRAVFTGSSRSGLAAMLSAREAPFLHFATPIELLALGGRWREENRGPSVERFAPRSAPRSERTRLPRQGCRLRCGGSSGSGSRTLREAHGSWPILGSGCGFGGVGVGKRRVPSRCRSFTLMTRTGCRDS